jgi:hypothetical protein
LPRREPEAGADGPGLLIAVAAIKIGPLHMGGIRDPSIYLPFELPPHPQTAGAVCGPQQCGFASAPQQVSRSTDSQHACAGADAVVSPADGCGVCCSVMTTPLNYD